MNSLELHGCPNCQANVAVAARFCHSCGLELSSGTLPLSSKLGIGVWVLDMKTGRGYIAPDYWESLGYARPTGEITVTEWLALVHPDDVAEFHRVYQEYDQGQRHEHRLELRLRAQDGSWRWMQARGIRIDSCPDSTPACIQGVFHDITEYKDLEARLRASESRLAEAQRVAKIGSWELDLTTNNLTWSDQIYQIFEMARSEFNASYEAFLAAVHPEDRQRVDQAYCQSLVQRLPYQIEHRLLMKDGRIKWVSERCETTFNEQGLPTRSYGTVQDITERSMAQQSESRWRLFADHAADAILIHDCEDGGRILDVNRQACESLGYSRDELIGERPEFYAPELTASRMAAIVSQLRKQPIVRLETYHRRRDGSVFPVAGRLRQFQTGGRLQAIAVCRDISERKQAEEQVALLHEQLSHAARIGTLGELASGLAHELNQPLTALQMYAGAALEQIGESEALVETLGLVQQQSLRAGYIVRRMRDFIARGVARHAPAKLPTLVEEVLSLLAHDLRKSNTNVVVEAEDDLPEVVLDTIQIQQVLVNLIRNAIEAMTVLPAAERRVTISLRIKESRLQTAVANPGRVLDATTAERLFQPFFTTKVDGLGLGLAICKTLVESHRGTIWYEVTAMGEACFAFSLPIGAAVMTSGPKVAR